MLLRQGHTPSLDSGVVEHQRAVADRLQRTPIARVSFPPSGARGVPSRYVAGWRAVEQSGASRNPPAPEAQIDGVEGRGASHRVARLDVENDPAPGLEAVDLEGFQFGIDHPEVADPGGGILALRSVRPVDGETISQTQSGAAVKKATFGNTGSRSRRQPAPSGTRTSFPRWSSGSRRIHQPPGAGGGPGGPWKDPATSLPSTVAAYACGLAGRGLTISWPSMISATFVSGTPIRSTNVARRLGLDTSRRIAPWPSGGATPVPGRSPRGTRRIRGDAVAR